MLSGAGTKPPTDGSLEIVSVVTLINATGTQAEPVKDFVLRGVGLRDTAPAVLGPHIAPTGGDWAVNRAAAVSLTGSLGATVANCTFWRLDNAVRALRNVYIPALDWSSLTDGLWHRGSSLAGLAGKSPSQTITLHGSERVRSSQSVIRRESPASPAGELMDELGISRGERRSFATSAMS